MVEYDYASGFMNALNQTQNFMETFKGTVYECNDCRLVKIQIKKDVLTFRTRCVGASCLSAPPIRDLIIKTTIRDNLLVGHMVESIMYMLKRLEPNNDYIAEVNIVPPDDAILLLKEDEDE